MAAKKKTVKTAEELREWVKSPEGQAAHADAVRRSRERTRKFRERVDRKILQEPMTI